MDSELESKIKEIGGMFGIENMPDNIGDIVASFLNSSGSENDKNDNACDCEMSEASAETANCSSENSAADGFNQGGTMLNSLNSLNANPAELLKLISCVNDAKNNTQNDYKINFLQALKPLLANDKRNKVDNCVKLLYFTKIAEQYKKLQRE